MELEKREDGWMERRGMGEYIEQWARPQRLKNGKNRCAFSYSQMKKLWGKEDDVQTRVPKWIKIQDDVYGYR